MAPYALYMTSHPRFMTSQPSTHDIKAIISPLTPIISESTSTESLSLHPNYRSYNPHCMYDNTATICMTSCKLHMTSHPLFMILHHAMTSHPLYSCVHVKSLKSCSTLCDPMDCSLPGSSVHGILQPRILELVVTPSSRGSSQPMGSNPHILTLPNWQAGSLLPAPPGKPLEMYTKLHI